MKTVDEYTITYESWTASSIMTNSPARIRVETFSGLTTVENWIETCRKAGIRISIKKITKQQVTYSEPVEFTGPMVARLKMLTGQNGLHTSAMEIQS